VFDGTVLKVRDNLVNNKGYYKQRLANTNWFKKVIPEQDKNIFFGLKI
jgi:hypothetical protein